MFNSLIIIIKLIIIIIEVVVLGSDDLELGLMQNQFFFYSHLVTSCGANNLNGSRPGIVDAMVFSFNPTGTG